MCDFINELLDKGVDYATFDGSLIHIRRAGRTLLYIKGLDYSIAAWIGEDCKPTEIRASGVNKDEARAIVEKTIARLREVHEAIKKRASE